MKTCDSLITITSELFPEPLVVPYVEMVKVVRDRKTIEEKCVIDIPYIKQLFQDISPVEAGAQIKVQIGYLNELQTEFEGVVTRRSGYSTISLECESSLTYEMKRTRVKPKSWKSVKLKEVLEYIYPGIETNVFDTTLENMRIEDTTQFGALTQIKGPYGLDIFARGQTVTACIPYADQTAIDAGNVVHDFQRNCVRVNRALEYKQADDVRIRYKGVSKYKDSDGKTQSHLYEAGDPDGGVHTLHFYGKSETELKELVDERLKEVKYDGLRGWYWSFYKPQLMINQIVELIDARKPEYNGRYFIDKTETYFNSTLGFKRRNFLGRKAS